MTYFYFLKKQVIHSILWTTAFCVTYCLTHLDGIRDVHTIDIQFLISFVCGFTILGAFIRYLVQKD